MLHTIHATKLPDQLQFIDRLRVHLSIFDYQHSQLTEKKLQQYLIHSSYSSHYSAYYIQHYNLSLLTGHSSF